MSVILKQYFCICNRANSCFLINNSNSLKHLQLGIKRNVFTESQLNINHFLEKRKKKNMLDEISLENSNIFMIS